MMPTGELLAAKGTLAVMSGLGFTPNIVPRPTEMLEAIAPGRAIFLRCQFGQAGCALGLKRLREYPKEWDDIRGV